ncbi:MAG TPA: cytochrome c biogenesis protein ResB [Candidatus Eremiobacteraceae bacterium]|nr:cytochrome c biogenesis protein ResB [Candidatus Eremiobacteraceae bacterium]
MSPAANAGALRERSLYDQTLDVLSNVMFPVVVFGIWAVLTIVGTSVDQNQPPERYYIEYGAPMANAILRLHLTNIFHSWPYITLVLLLLISMSVCTFRRVIPRRFPKDRPVAVENFGLHAQRRSTLDYDATCRAVDDYARRRGFSVRTQDLDGTHWLFADKQKWARYGVLVAHVGFAVIAIGVFAGWLWGYRGQLQIFSGQTASVPQAGLNVTLSRFIGRFEPVQTKEGLMYQASRFQSDVHVAGGDTDADASILVNHPFVTADHVYLYQASYGFGGNLQILRQGKPLALEGIDGRLGPQDVVYLPGTSRVIEYGTMLGPSDPSQAPMGVPLPRVDTYALWVFHDQIPITQKPILLPVGASFDAGDGYTIKALPPVAWSGLTYRYDPGELWVGAGALILSAGFVMALFFMPIKLYARVISDSGVPVVDIAATTTKGNAMYEDDFNALVNGLAERLAPPAGGMVAETVNAYA